MTPTLLHGAGYIKSFKGEKKTAAVSIFTDAFESFHFGETTICFAPASSVHYSMKYAAGEAWSVSFGEEKSSPLTQNNFI